ncbi:MAG: hypothetical protein IJW70_00105 [Clostridia bacterium]|nr:hypothetical protein [Clostridia bacterium]
MEYYQGIPISEGKLIVYAVVAAIFTAILIAAAILHLYQLTDPKNKKKAKELAHQKKLRMRADSDPVAKAQLEKLERKSKKNWQQNKWLIVGNVALLSLIFLCVAANIIGILVPVTMDLVCKDYVLYTGELSYQDTVMGTRTFTRRTDLVLADGTALTGTAGFSKEDTYRTVVYAKRSKIALGGQKAQSAPEN